jgi:hypothetical protein
LKESCTAGLFHKLRISTMSGQPDAAFSIFCFIRDLQINI